MSPTEKQTLPELQQKAVKIDLPADLLGALAEVKAQANALTGGNENWLDEKLGIKELILPGGWNVDEELSMRAEMLKIVIDKNPEWWAIWKEKIEFTNYGIFFKEKGIGIILEGKEVNIQTNWNDAYMNCMRIMELNYIRKFISSAGDKNISTLRKVLRFEFERYWANESVSASRAYGFDFLHGEVSELDKDLKCYHHIYVRK